MSEGEKVHLEVQEGQNWQSVGDVQLLPDDETATTPEVTINPRNQLPKSVKRLLVGAANDQRKHYYLFRHAPSEQPNANLLVLLHGAGDTHVPFDKLARTMALPQTATLSLSAKNDYEKLPFDLGCTWFQEMDYATGMQLSEAKQRYNRQFAATKLCAVMEELSLEQHWIIPERIFFLGFGAGAALVMQLCGLWSERGHVPFGGAICVAGGVVMEDATTTTTTTTPVLLMVGEKDDAFPPGRARLVKERYGNADIHVEPNKQQGMIQSPDEMKRVMEFLSKRLVRVSSSLPASI